MIMEILDFVFSSFWRWLGSMTMLYVIVHYFVYLLNSFVRHRTIRKLGYPPPHCNCDGQIHNFADIGKPNDDEE